MSDSNNLTQHPLVGTLREQLGEEVLQATMFQRVGADTARHVISHSSPLAGLALRFIGKKRAGGLPNMGILVVTPDKVKAYSTKGGGFKMRAKEEAAVWDRTGLRVNVEQKGGVKRITLESPAVGEKVTIESLRGYEQMTDELVSLIQS